MSSLLPAWLDDVQKRVEAATAGPWRFAETHGTDCIWLDVTAGETKGSEDEILNGETQPQSHIVHPDYHHQCQVGKEQAIADLEFVAHAREDIPALLAYARTLDAKRIGLLEALKKIRSAAQPYMGISADNLVSQLAVIKQQADAAIGKAQGAENPVQRETQETPSV